MTTDRFLSVERIDWRFLSYGKMLSTRLLLDLIERVRDGSGLVVDLGCGGGGVPQFLDRYVGIDLSFPAVSLASHLSVGTSKSFVCSDIDDVPIRTGVADVVLSLNVLEHTPDPAAVMREAARITRRLAVIVVPCRDQVPFFYDPVNWLRIRLGRAPVARGAFGYGHINVKSRAQWLEIFAAAGFQVVEEMPFDRSLIAHIEFFLFSLATWGREYDELPKGTASKRIYRTISVLHRIASFFDIKVPTSFATSFVLAKIG
jgi:SAM-dependent methyltransferase